MTQDTAVVALARLETVADALDLAWAVAVLDGGAKPLALLLVDASRPVRLAKRLCEQRIAE